MEGKSLRIVFMGTPGFAVSSLKALVENGYNVVGVVTSQDKPAGRGQIITASPVKIFAEEKGLHILQPANLKSEQFIEELTSLKADLQVVVAFRMLPEAVWDMPPLGTFNLHASLLPRYRGAAPINRAIIDGDTETGVTTFKIQHEIDTGNIIFQEKTEITPNDNAETLHDKLMEIGAKLVVKTVDALAAGNVKMISQDELIAMGLKPVAAPKIFKDDCRIQWNENIERIRNLVRGLSPYPAAWTEICLADGKTIQMKIYQASTEKEPHNYEPGTILTDKKSYLKIAAADGFIMLEELQLAGKKRMLANEFLRGFQQIDQFSAL